MSTITSLNVLRLAHYVMEHIQEERHQIVSTNVVDVDLNDLPCYMMGGIVTSFCNDFVNSGCRFQVDDTNGNYVHCTDYGTVNDYYKS